MATTALRAHAAALQAVRHTLTLVEPGGRLLVSVYQAEGGADASAAERLAELGIPVAGSASGDGPPGTATTAWVDA